ncbi:MAG: carboxylesterase family protein [Gammaproteobacteria bacterium]
MKKWLLVAAALVALVTLVAAGVGARWWTVDPMPGPMPAHADSKRALPVGEVVGFDAGHGAHGWLGIPYAAAPVGELRWRAPRPAGPWSGTREALAPGPVCPQVGSPLATVPRSRYGDIVGDEDCLYLNVWAPRHAPREVPTGDGRYPVMVWIHGGGNAIGHGADYDGSRLAGEHGLVVVSINYRLGVLGWFSHPAINGPGAAPEDRSGNFALLDMILALQWVRDNVAAFGGDPGRVTVFGESAGGLNIFGLMASPLAAGLFRGAISQSGVVRSTPSERARLPRADGGHPSSSSELVARWLVEQGRAPDDAAARGLQASLSEQELRAFLTGLDAHELLDGFDAPGGMYETPMLLEDGFVLPDRPVLDSLAERDAFNAVPLIAGSNRDEARLFMALDPGYVERRWGFLVRIRDRAEFDAAAGLLSDNWKYIGVDAALERLSRSQDAPVFSYRFDWDESGSNFLVDMPSLTGAAHGFELPFVFGDFSDFWGIPLLFTEENEAGRLALSDAMMSYWSEFAYSGDPGRGRDGSLPAWRPWDSAGDGQLLVLDTPSDGGLRMERHRVSLEDLRRRLLAMEQWSMPARPCTIYALIFWETELWDPAEYGGLSTACADLSPADLAVDPVPDEA